MNGAKRSHATIDPDPVARGLCRYETLDRSIGDLACRFTFR